MLLIVNSDQEIPSTLIPISNTNHEEKAYISHTYLISYKSFLRLNIVEQVTVSQPVILFPATH